MARLQEELKTAREEFDALLRDGSPIHIRPIRPEDEPQLRALFRGFSERSRALRFFVPPSDYFLAKFVARETQIDPMGSDSSRC